VCIRSLRTAGRPALHPSSLPPLSTRPEAGLAEEARAIFPARSPKPRQSAAVPAPRITDCDAVEACQPGPDVTPCVPRLAREQIAVHRPPSNGHVAGWSDSNALQWPTPRYRRFRRHRRFDRQHGPARLAQTREQSSPRRLQRAGQSQALTVWSPFNAVLTSGSSSVRGIGCVTPSCLGIALARRIWFPRDRSRACC
jgi:hypothetical protein